MVSQEMIRNFFEACQEEGLSLSQMEEAATLIENNLDKHEFYDQKTINRIRERFEEMDHCPACDGDFMFDEVNEERYCPKCDE